MSEQYNDQHRREVGNRVCNLRKRQGLSRERLAELAGISASLVKFVERGQRELTLRTAQRIAPLLGVRDLSELYGPAVRMTLDPAPSHPSVPAVRQALTAWPLTITGTASGPDYLRASVDNAWRTWHTSREQRSAVGAVLPTLLTEAQRSVRLNTGQDRRDSAAMLAQAYHLAQAYLAWHGDRELSWLTVDRAMAAAIDADQPLPLASACWYAAHILRAVGRSDEAIEQLRTGRALIEPRVADGPVEYAAMLADLDLCIALTKARNGDDSAWADWETAHQLAQRALPEDYVHPWTRVGRVLVDVYAVMIAVDLGRPDEARRRAQDLDPATIPSTDRRARHFIELARGTDMDGSPEATLHLLTQGARVSPETVKFSPAARDMAGRLVTNGPAAIRGDALELATQLGVQA